MKAGARHVFTADNPCFGSYEEALRHVGTTSERYRGEVPVAEGSVRMFCAMVEDANPALWDREVAERVFGGPVAPPALIQGTVRPLPWRPSGVREHSLAVFAVPLPGTTLINVSTDAVHHRPFFVGETVTYFDEIVAVSAERTTRLGAGHFVTSVFHYLDADGEPIASITNVMFRFRVAT